MGNRGASAPPSLGAGSSEHFVHLSRNTLILRLFAFALADPASALRRWKRVSANGVLGAAPDSPHLQTLWPLGGYLRSLGNSSPSTVAWLSRLALSLIAALEAVSIQ